MSECQANASLRAAAYYLQPTAGYDEKVLSKQRRTLRSWARKHGVEIVEEFSDRRPAPDTWGLYPGFSAMIVEWMENRSDYSYVLCLEQDQWWRLPKSIRPDVRPPAARAQRVAIHSPVVMSTVRKDGAVRLIRLGLRKDNAQKWGKLITRSLHRTAGICGSGSTVAKPRRRSRS